MKISRKLARIFSIVTAVCILVVALVEWRRLLEIRMFFGHNGNISFLFLLLPIANVIGWVLCVAGSLGILCRKSWGFYLIYVATVFSILVVMPFIPFIRIILPKESVPLFALLTNMIIFLLLIWAQITIKKAPMLEITK